MELILNLVVPVVFTLGLILLGFFVGARREKKHDAELLRREQEIRDRFVISELKVLPDWATSGALVTGSAVIASDYFKTFAAQLRALVGGEVRSFQSLMQRARREALLRAVDDARMRGGVGIANVRFETSTISAAGSRSGMVAVEILCFGTALVPAAAAAAAAGVRDADPAAGSLG